MDLSTPSPGASLMREAYWAGLACRIAAFAIPMLLVLSWYLGTAQTAAFRQLGLDRIHPLSATQFVLAITLSLLPVLALARSLVLMARCFDCFGESDWFGSNHPRALGSAGRWLVVAGILALMVPTFVGLVLTLAGTTEARTLVISLSSNGFLSILFGSLFWMLGHLWVKANGLARENARYI